jgi:HAD superfamily hydrolase (TIGR01549 family)
MIRGVIFDLGGTLMYFDGDWRQVVPAALDKFVAYLSGNGLGIDLQQFSETFWQNLQAAWRSTNANWVEYPTERVVRETLAQFGHPRASDQMVRRALEHFYAPMEEHWHAYPDACSTLEALNARHLRCGLISNSDDDAFIHRLVSKFGFTPWVDPVISSAAGPWAKPDARIFQLVVERWRIPPEELVMVGDQPLADVFGAHRAGMKAILLTGRGQRLIEIPSELQGDARLEPEARVEQVGQVLAIIEEM